MAAQGRPRRRRRWNTRVPRNPSRAPLGGCRVSLAPWRILRWVKTFGAGTYTTSPKKIGA